MKLSRYLFVIANLLLVSLSQAQSTFQGIGLFAGDTTGDALAIARNGQFVCGYSGTHAVLWTQAGGLQDIGHLPGDPGGIATGVSNSGVVVGESANQAFIWDSVNGMRGLGFLAGTSSSSADGISSDGSTVIGESGGRAFLWTAANGMQDIGAGKNSIAEATSADGSIVAGFAAGRAFAWTAAGGVVLLPDPGLGGTTEVSAMNSAGTRLVGTSFLPSHQMYYWSAPSGPEVLNGMNATSQQGANGISDNGEIACGNVDQSALVWIRGQGAQDFRSYLTNTGASTAGAWQELRFARGISADGTHIVGLGVDPNGHLQGWIATITPPAPSNAPDMSASSLLPNPRVGGNQVTLQVNLAAPAPSSKARISVTSLDAQLAPQTSALFGGASGIQIPAGAISGVLPANTFGVDADMDVHVKASYAGLARYGALHLFAAKLYDPILASSSVTGGSNVNCTLKLNGFAPSAGATVALMSSDPATASVPASATISSGAVSTTFSVTTHAVASQKHVTISATYRGYTKAVVLTVNP